MKQKANKLKTFIVAFIILTGLALFTSCEKYSYKIETGDPAVPVLFETDIQPIFTANCVKCHGGSQDPDLSEGKAFSSLTDGNYVSIPAESSKLYSKVISSSHSPYTPLPEEKFKILYWIQQGAKDN